MKQCELRFCRTEFRVSGEGEPAKIAGYAAVFDSQSEDLGYFQELREEIDPHAFDNVVAANPDVRGFFNHDPNCVLGRTTAGTLRLNVDARGLNYEIDPPDTQLARDLMVSLRRKDITGSSFSFACKRDQWTDNPDGSVTRRILEFDALYDVGPVTFPAYPAASSGVRSLPDSMPGEMRSRFEAKYPELRKSTDEQHDGGVGCSCECPECLAGDCDDCSNDDCDDPECACQSLRSLRSADADRIRRIRIDLMTDLDLRKEENIMSEGQFLVELLSIVKAAAQLQHVGQSTDDLVKRIDTLIAEIPQESQASPTSSAE